MGQNEATCRRGMARGAGGGAGRGGPAVRPSQAARGALRWPLGGVGKRGSTDAPVALARLRGRVRASARERARGAAHARDSQGGTGGVGGRGPVTSGAATSPALQERSPVTA